MAAQAQLSLHPSRNPHSHFRQYVPDAFMALLVVILIHVLFGLLLCGGCA